MTAPRARVGALLGLLGLLGGGCEAPPSACAAWAGTVAIPGGPFLMGSSQGGRDEAPAHEVRITGYCLDQDEATGEEISDWRAASGRAGAALRGGPEVAATGISWEEARLNQ